MWRIYNIPAYLCRMLLPGKAPLQEIVDSVLEDRGLQLFVKREDLIHSAISGNKWRKLYYNLQEAKSQKHKTLVTFGGAYSNHIAATAAAGKEFGFKTIGLIRGEEYAKLNPTLSYAKSCGMDFVYMNREDYRNKNKPEIVDKYVNGLDGYYLIPEGGTNQLAVKGCQEILSDVDDDFDIVACACGTGGTLSGLINSLKVGQSAIGFPALKGGEFLREDISAYVSTNNWQLNLEYHFGGYAKVNKLLIDFMNDFYLKHKFRLDPVYTSKMMYGLYDLIEKDYFSRGTKIIAIHTGGLQGIQGMNQRLEKKNMRIL